MTYDLLKLFLKPILHWSSNLDSIHFWSQTEFQSTNKHGLNQSRLHLEWDWWVFTLEAANQGGGVHIECG